MEPNRGLVNRLRPTRQGARVVTGLIIFGLIILGGLYFSPRAHSPAAPSGAMRGAPNGKLRIVAYDLARQHPSADPLFARLMTLAPDYLLLQGVNEDDAVEIAETLGLQQSFHPQLYQRSQDIGGRKGTWGNLILSHHSLYEGAPIGDIRGGLGGSAVSIIDGREFFIANLHLAAGDLANTEVETFHRRYEAMGKPPMIVVVLPSDAGPPVTLDFFPVQKNVDGEWFYLTGDWNIQESGTVPNSGTGLAPRWIDIVPRIATTQP